MTELSLTSRPQRRDDVRVHGTGDTTSVLTDERGAAAFQLNDTALALWELCDGRTSVAEMVGAITLLFAEEPASLQHDVLAALRVLLQDGLIIDTDG